VTWLTTGWPDSPGAVVGRRMVIRWLTADRNRLCRHEFHPHVHVVMKAISEEGERLNIRKAMLRELRKAFARHLRNHGVAAQATQQSRRQKIGVNMLKGIYRPVRTPKHLPYSETGELTRKRTLVNPVTYTFGQFS
jgi:hypothetical protein